MRDTAQRCWSSFLSIKEAYASHCLRQGPCRLVVGPNYAASDPYCAGKLILASESCGKYECITHVTSTLTVLVTMSYPIALLLNVARTSFDTSRRICGEAPSTTDRVGQSWTLSFLV